MTEQAYFLWHNGERYGPYTLIQMTRRKLTNDMEVAFAGRPEKLPIASISELAPYVTAPAVTNSTTPPTGPVGRSKPLPPPLPASAPTEWGGSNAPVVLADRGLRLAAALFDGLVMTVIISPLMYATGYLAKCRDGSVTANEQIAWSLAAGLLFLIVQGHALATRGQTIGKRLLGLQIVSAKTGRLVPFSRVAIYRYQWMLPIVLVAELVPGSADDVILGLISMIDPLMIFGRERRCLHDYIAGTIVIPYDPGCR